MREEIHLFGGQGWSGLFQDRAVAVAKNDACISPYTRKLLEKCHKCLTKDASHLYSEGADDVAQLLSIFATPDSLLEPPKRCHTQPLVQGTTLCLYQLLRYLARVRDAVSYLEAFNRLQGTAGFCSGILPAVIVASSPTIEDFIENGAQAFRAAFWIGYRAGAYSQNLLNWPETENSSWTYSLSGLSREQVIQLVSDFNSISKTEFHINLAGILRDSHVTVSGTSLALEKFLGRLPTSCVARPVHVNAIYHGGERMVPLVGTILNDFERYKVKIPSFGDLRRGVLSSFDGSELSETQSSKSLAHHILELILVKHVDWISVLRSLDIKDHRKVALVYGPNPNVLIPLSLVSTNKSLERLDVSHESPDVQLSSNYRRNENDIAIIGVGLDLPNASDLNEFWNTLKDGINCVSAIPDDRFPWQQHVGKDTHSTPYHGNFISNPWAFDNSLFNISPREARSMDPQQRVLLQCSFHALQHAGYIPDGTRCFQRSTFGCYVGAATGDYVERMSLNPDVYYSPGTLRAFLSGRISYYFGHSGPSVVVDTACSGSLVAIHQACKALIAKECNAALAGGVNVICGPDMQRGLARAHFLSPTGQCRPFDAKADGYCRAEGCAMFVLKRLSDAIAENDRILGVIKGTGINQSGGADSITHPHARTQKALFEDVLRQSGVLPNSIAAVEAHGTGTQAGDPVEFESIAGVFGNKRSPSSPLILSSIKGNIGHAEAASGGAGLVKLLMMVTHGQVPPQVGLEVLNPKIAALMNDSTIIPRQLQDWPRLKNMPRRALLNNFGAAGSNACIILEEYMDTQIQPSNASLSSDNSSYVFMLSAKDDETLERYRQSLLHDSSLKQIRPRDLAYTSTARRAMLDRRLVVTYNSTEHLFKSLDGAQIFPKGPANTTPNQRIVFVFSGQGSQYFGMGKELFEKTPGFRKDILRCEETLIQAGYPSILPLIQSHPSPPESISNWSIQATHCAVFAVEYALSRLWKSWGIHPSAAFGHSLGEYAAFVAANVLSMEDAILTIAHRASLIEEMCELGTSCMISVNAGASYVQDVISQSSCATEELVIACDNSAHQCVVSGPTKQIDYLATSLASSGVKTKKLDVPFGYHSPNMEKIRPRLNDFVANIPLREPSIPLGLGLYGRMHRTNDIDHDYFTSQAINPVRFRETVDDFLTQNADNKTIYMEIGPHPVLLPMVRAIAPAGSAIYLGSLYRDKECWTSICESIAELLRCGVQLDFGRLYEGQDVRLVDIPLYPFSREDFRLPYESRIAQRSNENTSSNIIQNNYHGSLLSLQKLKTPPIPDQAVYEASNRIEKLIQGHCVAGLPLCPASVYVELALQAAGHAKYLKHTNDHISVKNVIFSSPLVRQIDQSHSEVPVQVTVNMLDESDSGVSFGVSSEANGANKVHCEGSLQDLAKSSVDAPEHVDTMSTRFRGMQRHGQLIKRKMLYDTIFSRVVSYSEPYQTIDYLELSDSGKSAWGSFRLRQPALLENCVSQPVFVDTLLHAAGFLANCSVSASEVCICTKIESINIFAGVVDYTESFRLYTEISSTQHTEVGSSFAYDADGRLVGSVQGISFRRLRREGFTRSLRAEIRDTSAEQLDRDGGVTNHPMSNGMGRAIPEIQGTGMPSQQAQVYPQGAGIVNGNSVNGAASIQQGNNNIMVSEINKAIAEVAGLSKDKVHSETNLQQLGLDSLMALELLDVLKSRLGIDLPHTEFESCQTPKEIVALVASVMQPPKHTNGQQPSSRSLSLIQRGSNALAPLYLIHDGSGLCSMYNGITSLGRNVFGISCDDKTRFQTIGDMAAAYADLIDISQPFILGGWSFGGIVAYKMANILHDRRASILGVVMVDSPCPTLHEGIPKPILRRICHGKPDWLLRNFETHAAMLGAYSPEPSTTQFPVTLLRSVEAVSPDVIGDVPSPFLSNGPERDQQIALWKNLIGPDLRVLEIPGSHFQAFDEHIVAETSRSISQAIRLIEE
ncbi:polyketide beta-ketoacyl-synthase [Parahypoxylon ruwenzoriense]